MKNGFKKIILAGSLILLPTFLFSSCKTYRDHLIDVAIEKGLTKEQAELIPHGAYKKEFIKEDKDTGAREINYEGVTTKEALEKIAKLEGDANYMLDDEDPRIAEMMNDFKGMRESVEKERNILHFLRDTYKLHSNHQKFKKLIESGYYWDDAGSPFKLNLILPKENLDGKFNFRVEYIEEAKNLGNLSVLEDFRLEFDYKQEEKDLDEPKSKDKIAIKDKRIAVRIKVYDTGGDINPDYAEVFRIKPGGTEESKPAIKIFKSDNSSTLDVLVIDQDEEGAPIGFGIPDIVEQIYGIQNSQVAMQIFTGKEDLISKLYTKGEEKEKKQVILAKRREKRKNEMFVALAGETKIPEYEISMDPKGWQLPTGLKYKSKKGDNYTIELKFAKKDKKNKENTHKQINVVLRKYHSLKSEHTPSKGKVIEHYKPLPDFAKRDIIEAKVDTSNKRKLIIDREGEETKMGFDRIFLKEKPYAIEFSTQAGDRYLIVDKDLDLSNGYEARKTINGVSKPQVVDYTTIEYGGMMGYYGP